MEVFRSIAAVRRWRTDHPQVALVHTMGAFHDGHTALMRAAREDGSDVAVSLFVNPTQFGAREGLGRYPRREVEDLRMAAAAGVAMVFAPPVDEMYRDAATRVVAEGPALGWEGDVRRGHFDGVATVVAKLFNIFTPTAAWFGWKDLQQCAVIRQMVKDLDYGLRLEFLETVRDPDGLAMSSRNVFLTAEDRRLAARFPMILHEAATRLGQTRPETWEAAARQLELSTADRLRGQGLSVDYVAVLDPQTMRLADDPNVAPRIAAAIRIGGVRLIDNVPLASNG